MACILLPIISMWCPLGMGHYPKLISLGPTRGCVETVTTAFVPMALMPAPKTSWNPAALESLLTVWQSRCIRQLQWEWNNLIFVLHKSELLSVSTGIYYQGGPKCNVEELHDCGQYAIEGDRWVHSFTAAGQICQPLVQKLVGEDKATVCWLECKHGCSCNEAVKSTACEKQVCYQKHQKNTPLDPHHCIPM